MLPYDQLCSVMLNNAQHCSVDTFDCPKGPRTATLAMFNPLIKKISNIAERTLK